MAENGRRRIVAVVGVDSTGSLAAETFDELPITNGGGVPGPAGPPGPKGDTGTSGTQGPAGATGPTGPQGSQGPQGDAGQPGAAGSAGAQGPQGPAGSQGPAGPQGPQGAPGSQGPQGDTGATGPAGAAGAQGAQGIQGVQGPQGIQGPAGADANIAAAWPVGSLFFSAVSTNPGTLLGFGTWVAWGAGKLIIGRDTGQNAEDTLGSTTHSHAFSAPSAHTPADHTLSGSISTENAHTHAYTQTVNHVHPLATGTTATGNFSQVIGTVDTSSGGTGGAPTQTALATLSGNPSGGVASGTSAAGSAHGHGNGTLAVSAHASLTHNGSVTDGTALPPSIVAFIWKRTA